MDKTKETGNQVYRSYKDRLFRMVFREKKELLGLYNAVNGTSYTDPEALTVVTLENAIYMNMKNDLAVVMDFYMDLYEHQSTYNPNIPLRNLHYVARELRSWSNGRTIYGRQLVKIPTPRFFVFYNGRDMQPERQELKLSDAFMNPEEDPALELKVVMLNINLGRNKELMEQCHTLLEYAQFVDRLRTCEKSMGREEAVKHTVDTCIREGILGDFLLKYREEAIEMCIFEYDEEETLRQLGQQSYEEGVAAGIEQGRNEMPIDEEFLGKLVTENKDVPEDAKRDLIIALITLKYTQSNSVCYVKGGQAIGIGAGQQSRIHCTRLAGQKADNWLLRQCPKVLNLPFKEDVGRPNRDNAIDVYMSDDYADVLEDGQWQQFFTEQPEPLTREEKREWLDKMDGVALGSDAFFPFSDNVQRAHRSGVKYIAQPGGSIRDDLVIEACNEYGIAMYFSGMRLFHH